MVPSSLNQRIQDLPPKLHNQILVKVLEPSAIKTHTGRYQYIDRSYTFPTALHFDQTSRREFTSTYFGEDLWAF